MKIHHKDIKTKRGNQSSSCKFCVVWWLLGSVNVSR